VVIVFDYCTLKARSDSPQPPHPLSICSPSITHSRTEPGSSTD